MPYFSTKQIVLPPPGVCHSALHTDGIWYVFVDLRIFAAMVIGDD